jgi:adenylate cyclase
MSGDQEQEYFSDGISEDIITDLSKVSALSVTARNTAFTFKGKHVDVPQVARQLKVAHVLEGSVRKSGNRVRITAQLIDAKTGDHVWAERYDRDMGDIFSLQDEITEAIVKALKVRLLPEEKKDIERRGTNDPEAYRLYLMARQHSITGNFGNARRNEVIIRLCRRATEIDPNYARAWALIASAQATLRFNFDKEDTGLAAAERAIALDPDLAEAHAIRGRILISDGRHDVALREIETALRLDSESYEVNKAVANCYYQLRRFDESIACWEKAAALVENDYMSVGMLSSCYLAIGDKEGGRRAAQLSVSRAEKILAVEPDNGSVMGFLVGSLAALGEVERAKAWAERAMLFDPDNGNMRYNIACSFATDLNDHERALDFLGPWIARASPENLEWAKADSDLDRLRDHPRFKAMIAAAETRLSQTKADMAG